MDENKDTKIRVIGEQVFDVICLAASYGILFLLPRRTGIVFYLIFGAAAFLFCIGFFRLGFTFDTPAGRKGTKSGALLSAVFGVLINAAGLYAVLQDHGSGRSIMIATLLMIEALLLYAMAAGGAGSPESQWRSAVLLRIAAVIVILLGAAFAVWKRFSESSVIIGTVLLIEGICLWKMGGGSNPFNTLTPEIQSVPRMRTPIGQLQAAFAGVETQLGYPRVGKVRTIRQDAIIYGPSEDGFTVYGYYIFGRFYVAGSTNLLFPGPEGAQDHTVREVPDSCGTLLAAEDLPKAYADMFSRYAESGETRWLEHF